PVANRVRGIWRRNNSRTRFRASGVYRFGGGRPPGSGRWAGYDREGISMSDFDRNYAPPRRGFGTDQAVAVGPGLRAYMVRVYNYMAVGVALTGVVAWLTFNAAAVTDASGKLVGLTAFGQAIYSGPATIVLFLGTLGLVFFISWRIDRLQPSTAFTLFMV